MMTLKAWQSTGDFFTYGKHRLFYKKAGQGPALLLLHGFPTASWDWHLIWQPLQKYFTVFTLDLLGFGFSDKPKQNYLIHQQADIVIAFLSDQKVVSYHLLAHDYGDIVAQEILARANKGVKIKKNNAPKLLSLCLLNGGLFPETHHPLLVQKVLMSPIGWLVAKLFTKKKLQQNLEGIFGSNTQPTRKNITDFWTLMTHNQGKRVFHLLIRYMQQRKKYRSRWVGALQQTLIPIQLINGVADPISGAHMVDRYCELIPQPNVVTLEDIGQYPQIEAPEVVLQHYLSFVLK